MSRFGTFLELRISFGEEVQGFSVFVPEEGCGMAIGDSLSIS